MIFAKGGRLPAIAAFAAALALSLIAVPASRAQSPAETTQPAPPPQQAAPPSETFNGSSLNDVLAGWKAELDRIEQELAREALRYRELDALRGQIEAIRQQTEAFRAEIQPRLNAAAEIRAKLGEAPKEGAPPEPEAVARQRAEIDGAWSRLTASLNAAETSAARAAQLTASIQDIRRRIFTNRLFSRAPGVFSLDVWASAPANTVASFSAAQRFVERWWAGLDSKGDVIQTVAIAFMIWLALTAVGWRGVAHFRAWRGEDEPPFWRRASSAAWVILMRAGPPAAAAIFLYQALSASELLSQRVDRLLYAAVRAVVIFSIVAAIVTTLLAPSRPHWRIFPASDAAARRLRLLLLGLAGVFCLNQFLGTLNRVAAAELSLTVAQSLVASLAIAALIVAILRTRLEAASVEDAPRLNWLGVLRLPMWIVAAVIVAAALSGYVSLARFISAQLVVTGSILTLVYLLLIWTDAFAQSMSDEEAPAGRWLKNAAGLDQRRREQLALPVTLLLKFIVLLLAVPLIMLQWGFNSKDVMDWLGELFFGFRIGNTQISIAAIIAAVMVFILGYFAARLFQSWLDRQVLKPAGISGGARDSIRTGVGYLGVFAAGVAAFSYAGVDLSSLAIVAGAFSVGIGFGLQSVVSNFVSGLILLAERPIKVGDWVVGGEEGYVRRISVRSTEIETFDKANVIVPNAYFITETVKNWTLHNNTGRVVIPVGVDYSSDPALVRDTLLDVARDNPQVMSDPAPFVFFEDFGSDALQFKLYAYIYNVTSSMRVRTDLRIAILRAFREKGIAMPYRQTEVHLRNIDWLRDALADKLGLPNPARSRQTAAE